MRSFVIFLVFMSVRLKGILNHASTHVAKITNARNISFFLFCCGHFLVSPFLPYPGIYTYIVYKVPLSIRNRFQIIVDFSRSCRKPVELNTLSDNTLSDKVTKFLPRDQNFVRRIILSDQYY